MLRDFPLAQPIKNFYIESANDKINNRDSLNNSHLKN